MAALAISGVAGGFVGPAIEVVKWISAPLRRQFSYLCCFRGNINSLKGEANNLEDETRGLQMKVDAARNNAQLILPQVETWLRNSDDKRNQSNGVLDQVPNVGNGCFKLRERYSLSKRAKKATVAIKELVGKCKFSDISGPPPMAASAPVQSGTTTYDFESRKVIEEEILKSLGDKNVCKIGICGMGGLGKTTLARKIMNGALKEGLFDEVVMAVVSQPVDKLNIQLQIAEPLGLTLGGNTLISRANVLRKRLKGNKKTLLVMDDVWRSLDLEELGIPCEYGCRVLITSRDNGVLRAMDVEKICELNILDEKEAWILFRGKAGMCVDDAALNPIAKDVTRECKGLPLALATVGIALKDEKDVSIWEDALGQLRRSNPSDIPSVIEQVYNPLKLSYDCLGNQNAKSLLLMCCLFAEDDDIPLEHLAYFATGLHLFEDIEELKEVRGRTCALVKMLKTRGLLLDGSDEDHVRMHDVARDVSIFMASKEGRVKCRDCAWISSHVDGGTRLVPPLQSCFTNLKLLLMNMHVEKEMEINDNLIGRSTKLNVVFIEGYSFLRSLSKLSTSVATLILYRCLSLESIAAVGQMKSLEIFICHHCYLIEELPEQVRGLKRLKLLQISECPDLERIAAGVISSMVALEELKIVDSFKNWQGGEIHEEGRREASLREIESLKKLRCLEIEVSDIALAALPLRLSSKPVRFRVRFGKEVHTDYDVPDKSYERRMSLVFGDGDDIKWGDLSANIFLTRTECLYACGTIAQEFELNLATAPSIRWLTLIGFWNWKNITSAAAAFPLLHFLFLRDLRNLKEIWDDDAPIPSNSFNNLKELRLEEMRALKRMGKSVISTANNFFLQLETIEIYQCYTMEHLLVLVPNEEEQDNKDHISTVLIFPKLKTLFLCLLPKFRSICSGRGIESIQFPLLAEMKIQGCENLKWLVSRDDDADHYQDADDYDDNSLHLFCHSKVSFGNLKILTLKCKKTRTVWCDKVPTDFFRGLVELKISYYDKIRSLFSSSKIPQNLVNLQKLEIFKCEEMVRVIEDEEEVSSSSPSSSSCDAHTTKHITTLFPSLQEIQLIDLPKLESFCEWRCALELPSLKILDINGSDEMKSFNIGSVVITPAVTVSIEYCRELEYAGDLNATLRHHFEKAKRAWDEFLEEERRWRSRKESVK